MKAVIAQFEVQPPKPTHAAAPAVVPRVESAEPAIKKKPSRLKERRAVRVAAAIGSNET